MYCDWHSAVAYTLGVDYKVILQDFANAFYEQPFALMSSSACQKDMTELCRKRLGANEHLTHFLTPVGMQLNMGETAFYVAITVRRTALLKT